MTIALVEGWLLDRSTVVVFEGARGVGKTHFAQALREAIQGSHFFHPGGDPDPTGRGLDRTLKLYMGYLNFLKQFKHDNVTFIFDRFFFSELVFSQLYKKYSFRKDYPFYLEKLVSYSSRLFLVLVYGDERLFAERLRRSKSSYLDIPPTVAESLRQQDKYFELFDELEMLLCRRSHVRLLQVNGAGDLSDRVAQLVSLLHAK